jgi:hypothetical protein
MTIVSAFLSVFDSADYADPGSVRVIHVQIPQRRRRRMPEPGGDGAKLALE